MHVVIPTKSNLQGLKELLSDLSNDQSVETICVVADGDATFAAIADFHIHAEVIVVPEGSGIQYMWNRGMEVVGMSNHVAFLNDDVRLGENCMSTLTEILDNDSAVGLVCPNYSDVEMFANRDVFDTCRSRYDGTGGMAGFAMVLHRELITQWTFDENLTWWYGDDDLVRWVTHVVGKRAVISCGARCVHDDSATIRTNPPTNFGNLVEQDRLYFESKWSV